MKRGPTGSFAVTRLADETIRAFIPDPLPPKPPLDLQGSLQPLLERALLALGRLDSVTTLLPEPSLFLYGYVRKEAVLSSQIEGTQSSLSELLLFELEQAPGAPVDDVVEVSNYVRAQEYGLKRLEGGFPLSTRLMREIHGKLLARGRGSDKTPGEFRRSQNWIGGTRPGNAHFVPPPSDVVATCMSDLEKFLHREGDGLPILVKAALAHVQFETIHPFLDGNGRVGRLLITFYLCHAGLLRQPLLYLSLYFKQHRSRYYELLDACRQGGDWEAWTEFFLEGVASTAEGAVETVRKLEALFARDHARLLAGGRKAGAAVRVHEVLQQRPIIELQEVARRAGLSYPTAGTGMRYLLAAGIAGEITGQKRNRAFAYTRYMNLLNEGTAPLAPERKRKGFQGRD